MGPRYLLTLLFSGMILFLQYPSIKMAKFDLFSKVVRCYELNEKFVANVSCQLKVTRQVPTGLIFVNGDVTFINDIFLRFTLFYRYTGGFRPYLADYSGNACELAKQGNYLLKNPVINGLVTGTKETFPRLFDGCPYKGHYESKWYDINASFSQNMPPIVPEGRYKFKYRAYTSKNETIFIFENQLDVKPAKEFRATDFSMLNMG